MMVTRLASRSAALRRMLRDGYGEDGDDPVCVERRQHPALPGRGLPQPTDEDDGRGHHDEGAGRRLHRLSDRHKVGPVGDRQRVARDRAVRGEEVERRLEDQAHRIPRDDDDQGRAGLQPARGERQEQVHDHAQGQRREHDAHRDERRRGDVAERRQQDGDRAPTTMIGPSRL